MVKFDKRYTDSIYNQRYISVSFPWSLLRNQTPENEKKLEELYLRIKPPD